jgi:large subunit ribosomal protein L23
MGIFGKKDTGEATSEVAVVKAVQPSRINTTSVTSVIIKPRITEKAALLSDKNVYTFEIKKGATKFEVRDAIKALYNVTPVRVHIVNKQPRHSMSRARGRDMMENGLRKAYVYLKKGDRIELV